MNPTPTYSDLYHAWIDACGYAGDAHQAKLNSHGEYDEANAEAASTARAADEAFEEACDWIEAHGLDRPTANTFDPHLPTPATVLSAMYKQCAEIVGHLAAHNPNREVTS